MQTKHFSVFSIIVALIFVVSLLGCAAAPAAQTDTKTTVVTPTATKVITWKTQPMYVPNPTFGPWKETSNWIATSRYIKWLEQVSNGRLKIESVAPNSLFPVAESLNALQKRVIDFLPDGYGGYWAGVMPEGGVEAGIPFNATTAEELYVLTYDYGVYDLMKEAYAERNIYYASLHASTPTAVQSTFAMTTMDSFKGKKIRASGFDGETIALIGAAPVNIPIAETYMAMKLGTVDGLVANRLVLESAKLKEVSTALLTNSFKFYGKNCLFNMDALKELPADLQETIKRDSKYVLTEAGMTERAQEFYMQGQIIKQYGLKTYTWSETDMSKLTSMAVAQIWPKLSSLSPRTAKLIECHKKFLQDYGRL